MNRYLLLFLFLTFPLLGDIYLRDNLKQAEPGDFIVTAQGKMFTLLHIHEKNGDDLIIEEVSVPENRMPSRQYTWRSWVEQSAPYHTSWVMYRVNLATGRMTQHYNFAKNEWRDMSNCENFLSTLLNLRMSKIPTNQRRRVGNSRRNWSPKMVVDGRTIPGVPFDAWRTHWPDDGSDLAGKTIEVFVPEENTKYPSYFPYWLQIKGFIGKAKVRIIDSGTNLKSPKQNVFLNVENES